MSPDAVAALLGGLTGAGATLGIGFISRAWASQDARNASRREYVTAVTERLQRIVKVKTVEELAALNHEMFGVNALGVYIPRGEDDVHIWYAIRDVTILQLAMDSWKGGGKRQSEVFNLSIDAASELRAWARGEKTRRARWFKNELRTTDQAMVKQVKAASELAEAAAREAAAAK